ncbi:MAG: branched-chain amino acid transaminase [Candidatus Campbellbacteria bacterium]|nr:branched-chain amino acid transaminase [Candidatus Campbellbacteria bacterium]
MLKGKNNTMEDRDGWIWFDGKFVPWRDAKTHVLTHTLHYGMGVFEGLRAYDTEKGSAIFRLKDHTKRLFNSAKIVGIKIPFTEEELIVAQKESVKKNNLKTAYIRPMVFYGAESMGLHANNLKVHCIVAAWSWGSYLGEENIKRGIKLKTSSFPRFHPKAEMCGAKTNGCYINSIIALQEALDAGCDEALMLDIDGHVAEGSGENIFIVSKGALYTPHPTAALNGITRQTIIKFAEDEKISVAEKKITLEDVKKADEVFLTGTAAEVTPVREIDGCKIGSGSRGPITQKLQNIYFDVVTGKNDSYSDWLSVV